MSCPLILFDIKHLLTLTCWVPVCLFVRLVYVQRLVDSTGSQGKSIGAVSESWTSTYLIIVSESAGTHATRQIPEVLSDAQIRFKHNTHHKSSFVFLRVLWL